MEDSLIDASVYNIRTLVDGGVRIQLDVGAEARDIVKQLMDMKLRGDEHIKVLFVNPDAV